MLPFRCDVRKTAFSLSLIVVFESVATKTEGQKARTQSGWDEKAGECLSKREKERERWRGGVKGVKMGKRELRIQIKSVKVEKKVECLQ